MDGGPSKPSTEARIKSQALVSRLQMIGDRAKNTARMCNMVGRENRRLEEEMIGQWQAFIRALVEPRGNFLVPP